MGQLTSICIHTKIAIFKFAFSCVGKCGFYVVLINSQKVNGAHCVILNILEESKSKGNDTKNTSYIKPILTAYFKGYFSSKSL